MHHLCHFFLSFLVCFANFFLPKMKKEIMLKSEWKNRKIPLFFMHLKLTTIQELFKCDAFRFPWYSYSTQLSRVCFALNCAKVRRFAFCPLVFRPGIRILRKYFQKVFSNNILRSNAPRLHDLSEIAGFVQKIIWFWRISVYFSELAMLPVIWFLSVLVAI